MSGDLTLNKIFGAVLATGLVIMGVKIGSEMIFEPHHEKLEKDGYHIDVAETGGEGGAAAAVDTPPDWGTVLPAADLAAGEAVFKKCESCHNATQGGANMTGPNLWGVVGRPTASHAGMSYSDAMMAHAKDAPNWTYDQLYMFLGAPAKWVKGTKMTFAGVKKPDERINLIAYLRSQGSPGYPIPAPDPSRAAGAAAPASGAAPAAPPGVDPAAGKPATAEASAAAKPVAAPAAAAPAKAAATTITNSHSGTPANTSAAAPQSTKPAQ